MDVRASLVSAGTERRTVETGRKSLLAKARARPDQARLVLDKARRDGVGAAAQAVRFRLGQPAPLGYSAAGVVIAAGSRVSDLAPGDRVACAGAGFATHAEIDYVPANLAVPVPEGVSFDDAAFATVGAIALHAVRQADARLGERVAVIGLGLVGPARRPDPPRRRLPGRRDRSRLGARRARPGGRRRRRSRSRERARRRAAGVRRRLRRRGHHRRDVLGRSRRAGRTALPRPRPGRRRRRRRPRRAARRLLRQGALAASSRAPTAPAATTPSTRSAGSTTRSATCAGPSGATWRRSSTSSRPGRCASRAS